MKYLENQKMKIIKTLSLFMMVLVGCTTRPNLQLGSPVVKSYYVSTTGKDSNPGTLAQPWLTIQKAANSLEAGDTVTVVAGDYTPQRVSITRPGSSGASITYLAQGLVKMRGFDIAADYITIRGFEITNPVDGNPDGVGNRGEWFVCTYR